MTPVVIIISVPALYIVIAAAIAVSLVLVGVWRHSTGMYRAGLVTAPPLMAAVVALAALYRNWPCTASGIATSIGLLATIVNFEMHSCRARRRELT
jgi:hypothetical protein